MNKAIWLAIPAALMLIGAGDGGMTVADFIGKVEGLQKKGPFALFSPDVQVLKNEIDMQEKRYRAAVAADRAAGRTPRGCPPPVGQDRMSNKEFMKALRKVPGPERASTSMTAAFTQIMNQRYPCPAK